MREVLWAIREAGRKAAADGDEVSVTAIVALLDVALATDRNAQLRSLAIFLIAAMNGALVDPEFLSD